VTATANTARARALGVANARRSELAKLRANLAAGKVPLADALRAEIVADRLVCDVLRSLQRVKLMRALRALEVLEIRCSTRCDELLDHEIEAIVEYFERFANGDLPVTYRERMAERRKPAPPPAPAPPPETPSSTAGQLAKPPALAATVIALLVTRGSRTEEELVDALGEPTAEVNSALRWLRKHRFTESAKCGAFTYYSITVPKIKEKM